MSVLKNTIKKIGHCVCFGDVMGQTCPIYACTGINLTHHFTGSWYIFAAAGSKGF